MATDCNYAPDLGKRAADEMIAAFNEGYKQGKADAIKELQKRKHGKWSRKWEHRNGFDYAYEVCSECGAPVNVCGYDYCPTCGAKMEDNDV